MAGQLWSSDHASIDPTFNAIKPRGVILERDLVTFIGAGQWPRSMLLPFMHEVTHHWCLRGPVGNALSVMNLRSCETALFGTESGEKFRQAAYEHYLFRAVVELFRPLLEGMALFAEFDIVPGRGAVVSDPMHFAWLACMPRTLECEQKIWASAGAALRAERVSEIGLSRKMNVLKHPMGEIGCTYFRGYLMVKSLHRLMCRNIPQAEETDWFLCFLRDYIFFDPGMVTALLQEPPRELSHLQMVSRRVFERLSALVEVSETDAQEFDASANDATGASAWPAGTCTSTHDERAATLQLENLRQWFAEECDSERRLWRARAATALEARTLALTAAEQVEVRVSNAWVHTRLADPVAGETWYSLGAADATEPDWNGTGWTAVMLRLGREPFLATIVGNATKVLSVRTVPHSAIDEPQVRSILFDSAQMPPQLSELMSIVEAALGKLRVEAVKRFDCIGAEESGRSQAAYIALHFIDMLSEHDSGGRSSIAHEKTNDIFSDQGIWPLFSPNETMLRVYCRAALGGTLSAAHKRSLERHTAEIEARFNIKIVERRRGRSRYLF